MWLAQKQQPSRAAAAAPGSAGGQGPAGKAAHSARQPSQSLQSARSRPGAFQPPPSHASGSGKRAAGRRGPSIMTNPLFNGYLSNLTKKMQETSLDKREAMGTKIETPL